MNEKPKEPRRPAWTLLVAALLLCTGLVAWCTGTESGQRQARELINQENDTVTGPASLIPTDQGVDLEELLAQPEDTASQADDVPRHGRPARPADGLEALRPDSLMPQ